VKECDELFKKYQADGWIGPTSFKAALREYGALVRKEDVAQAGEEMILTPDEMASMKKVEEAYTRLSFLHTETMAELVATRERMDAMSASWWWMLKHRIAVKLGMTGRFE
jgi:hypothetical protein